MFLASVIVVFAGLTLVASASEQSAKWQDDVARKIALDDGKHAKEIEHQFQEDRALRIKELIKVIETPTFHEQRQGVGPAMRILGEMRAVEAVDTLVKYIQYPNVIHPKARQAYVYMQLAGAGDNSTALPAIPALIKIGVPSVKPVVKRFADSDDAPFAQKACGIVLAELNKKYHIRSAVDAAVEDVVAPERQKEVRQMLQKVAHPVGNGQRRQAWHHVRLRVSHALSSHASRTSKQPKLGYSTTPDARISGGPHGWIKAT